MKNLADYIMVVDDVLPPELCQSMIQRFEDHPVGGPYFRTSKFDWGFDYREFVELNISLHQDFKDLHPAIWQATDRMYRFYREAVNAPFLPDPDRCGYEEARMKRYFNNDHDQFGLHADVGDHQSAKRALALFTYLNDVEEGGETVFTDLTKDGLPLTVKPKQGRMVLFPPMWLFPHKGMKPVSNDKYIVSQYIHYL